jgi:hypothetical protein
MITTVPAKLALNTHAPAAELLQNAIVGSSFAGQGEGTRLGDSS